MRTYKWFSTVVLGALLSGAMALTACDSSVSADDDEDTSSSSKKTTSSSSKKTSSSSSSDASEDIDEDAVELSVPSNLKVSQMTDSTWLLTWEYTPAGGDEEGFLVQVLDLENSVWKKEGTSGQGVYKYVLKGKKRLDHFYRVAAYVGSKTGQFSSDIYITEKGGQEGSPDSTAGEVAADLPIPGNLQAYRVAPSVFVLEWEYSRLADRPASGFEIEYMDPTGKWVRLEDKPDSNSTRYILNGLKNAERYYRVRAFDADGVSEYSNEVLVTKSAEYREDISFTVPKITGQIRTYLDICVDTTTLDYITKSRTVIDSFEVNSTMMYKYEDNDTTKTKFLDLTLSSDVPNNAVLFSDYKPKEYTKKLYYQVRWLRYYDQDTTYIDTVHFDIDVQSVSAYIPQDMMFTTYGQVRIVWEDVNGVTDYTEWSLPVGNEAGSEASNEVQIFFTVGFCTEYWPNSRLKAYEKQFYENHKGVDGIWFWKD
ncbi:MAG: fibronectin type III domain-containing protein [Fibrobacteraceae bacterium]|nr:fibronectin type III domain-containing protein [Fibrobacteraceae bacterium]MCF0217028.1 fibronectin type III domain-containing protein [Fibrobacteraceae bacterium]